MTLLQKLSNQQNNAIKNILNIIDDQYIEDFTKNKVLIHNSSGTNYYENLAREIFVQTIMSHYIKEGNMPYEKETYCENSKRADLTFKFGNSIAHCIEFKAVTSSMLKNTLTDKINEAKSQIETKYVNNNQTSAFATVVLMDVEKICENPKLLNNFLNFPHDFNTLSICEIINRYGIYIETYLYNPESNYRSKSSNYFPKLCFYKKETVVYDTINKCRVIDSLILPSNSGVNGVKNVRDIKDPYLSLSKQNQVISIFETVFNAFKDGRKDELYLNGQQKCFITVGSENSVQFENYQNEYCIISTNAALVDGQNSIDAVRTILDILENKKINDKSDKIAKAIKRKTQEILKQENFSFNINTEIDINKLVDFIKKDLYYGISILTAENEEKARQYAKNRNQSIQVSDNELKLAPLTHLVNMFNYYMQDKYNIFMMTPQRITMGLSEEQKQNSTDVLEHFSYNHALTSILAKSEKLTTGNNILKSVKSTISTSNKARYLSALKKIFITNQENFSIEMKLLKEEEAKIQKDIDLFENIILTLPEDSKNELEDKISNLKMDLEDCERNIIELKSMNENSDKHCNLEELEKHKNLHQLIKDISFHYNAYMKKNTAKAKVISSFVNKIENNKAYIFYMLVMKFKENFHQIKKDDILKIINQYVNRVCFIKKNYSSFNVTVYRTDTVDSFKQHSFPHNTVKNKFIYAGNACDYIFGLTDNLFEEDFSNKEKEVA